MTHNCSFVCTIPRGEHCPIWDMDYREDCCTGCRWYQPVDDTRNYGNDYDYANTNDNEDDDPYD